MIRAVGPGAASDETTEHDLWRFSQEFYVLPGVAPALIALQDRDERDVNLVLFALWLGVTGRSALDSVSLGAAEKAVRDIRSEIVHPLRSLRRRLKGIADNDVQRLREGVKALELAAEKLCQDRLVALAEPAEARISARACLTRAQANLALYLGPLSSASAEASLIRSALAKVSLRRCAASEVMVHPSV